MSGDKKTLTAELGTPTAGDIQYGEEKALGILRGLSLYEGGFIR